MSRAVGAALVLIVAWPVVAAAAETLAVVDLSTPPSMVALGAQLTSELARSARERHLVVIAPEAVRATVGELGLSELQQCRGEPRCVAALLQPFGKARAVGGTLDRDGANYKVQLWLVDVARGTPLARYERAIPIASRRLVADVTAAIPRLLAGEAEPRGVLALSSDLEGTAVTVDGAPAGQAPLRLELPPGEHRVGFAREGSLPVERSVLVEAGAEAKLDARMIPAPLPAEGNPTRERRELTAPGGLRVPGLALTAFTLGAGALGTGVGLSVSAARAEQQGHPGLAGERRRWVTPLYVGAGAAVAAGLVLSLVDTLRAQPAKLAIVPVEGGALVVTSPLAF